MTGCLKIKNDTYYAVLNFKEGGKYKQKWITTKLNVKGNKRKATEFLNNLLNEYSDSDFLNKKESIKFTDYLEKWLKSKKGKIEQSTWDGYYNSIVKHIVPYFKPLDLDITDLKPKHIRDYYDYKFNYGRLDGKNGGLTHKSIKHHSVAIKGALNNALMIDEIISKNPATKIPIPERKDDSCKKKEFVFLSAEEANQMLKLFENHRLQLLVYVTLYYGLRRSEVLGLKWNAVDLKQGKLTIKHTIVKNLQTVAKDRTKSKTSNRSFKISNHLIELFQKHKEQQEKNKRLFGKEYIESDYIFTWEDGRLYRPDYITSAFKKALRESEFKNMRFHDLRHSCASILYDKGWGLKDIQKWLGHADIETTGNIYTHINQDRESLVADDMENTLLLEF